MPILLDKNHIIYFYIFEEHWFYMPQKTWLAVNSLLLFYALSPWSSFPVFYQNRWSILWWFLSIWQFVHVFQWWNKIILKLTIKKRNTISSNWTYTTQILKVHTTDLGQYMIAPSIYQLSTYIFNSIIICLVHFACLELKRYSSHSGAFRLLKWQRIKINKAQVII